MLDNEALAVQAQANFALMNNDQTNAFNAVVAAPQTPAEQPQFFIEGPGGTGISFVYNTLTAHAKGVLDKNIIVVASSWIAALVLHGGQTAHSTFKIPIPIQAHSSCNIRLGQEIAATIREADGVFWDEAPIQYRHVFEAVDRSFRNIMQEPDIPFGGKVMVFGGDFRQVLPVVVRGSRGQIVNACLNKSEAIWPSIEILRLTTNMRAQDQVFAAYLLGRDLEG